MKLEQLEKGEKAVFKMQATPIFANLIRREILENVPSMAIDSVEVRKNSSALYDEMLSLRLGLLPLTTDLTSYEMPGEEESLKTHLKLTLQAKGPGTVYASDIKSKDPKVKPAQPNMPIVKLLKGQEVEVEATACLGTGKEHMKFAPAYAFYAHTYTFKQNKALDNAADVIKKCPEGIFKEEKGKLVPQDESQGFLWDTCLQYVPEGAIDIKENPEEVIFTVESFGQLKPAEILEAAATAVEETIDAFEKEWK